MESIRISKSETQALLERLTDSACLELFSAYGVPLRQARSDTSPGAPILLSGVAGFSGPGIRGTCILASTERPIADSLPVQGSLRDWIAELANQLVGRMKNKLLNHGAEVYVTTPVVLRGEHLAPMPRRELPPLAYVAEAGSVFVWIELETEPEFVLGPPTVAALEGETLMF